jgi:hypothetical protein
METLTVINYQPPGSVIHKPFFKSVPRSGSVKKAQFDFPDMPIEELQSAGIGRSNLQPKTARDSKPTTYDVQASKGILAKTQGMCSDCICRSVRLSLMLSDSFHRGEARLRWRY